MKNTKKILSIFLALIMIISIIPMSSITAFAEDSATSGTCGENLAWTFDESTGTLTISGTGEMNDYSSSNRPWESYEDSIISVYINNGATTIGSYAFYNCNNLANVTIPGSVTTIRYCAFYDCDILASIIIPDSVRTIEFYAFYNCDSLASIIIPDSVITIGDSAFYNTAYYNNSSNWENDVLYINNHLIVARFSLSGSYTIKEGTKRISNYAFFNCDSLTSITIPDSVTTIGSYAFAYCDSLTSVTIGNNVTIIGDSAFDNCVSLTNVTIPDSVTTIGDWTFYSCTSLTSVTIPNSVTTIGDGVFCSCVSLTSITVNSNNEYYSSDEYGVLFNKDKTILIQYPVGNSRTSYTIPNSVTIIGNYAFSGCYSLTNVTIQDSVTIIGDSAFDGCDILTDVYYSGTEEHWNNISIGVYNDTLFNVTIHFLGGENDSSNTGEHEYKYTFSIQSPSRTEIRNKDGIILHANVEGTAPNGSYVRWESSNGNFDKSVDGSNLKIVAKNKGWTTFTAILCDADGNELARDTVDMYSKSGFFDKIGGFFRSLFGTTKVYDA